MSTFRPSIPGRFLFRMAFPCLYLQDAINKQTLAEKFAFPDFSSLENPPAGMPKVSPLEVRGAWCEEGLAFQFTIRGKRQPPWCREHQQQMSDRVELWLDTRDVRNVHRATKFCHRYALISSGGGKNGELPMVALMPINRAKEHPNTPPRDSISLVTKTHDDGYTMMLHLYAKAMTGFYPDEYPRLGIAWAMYDREVGDVTLTAGQPFSFQDDPSLWYTLELVRE